MKKLTILSLVTILVACNTSNVEPLETTDIELLKSNFKEVTLESLNFATTLDFVDVEEISEEESQLTLKVENVSVRMEKRLLQHQFEGSSLSEIRLFPVSPSVLQGTIENARVSESIGDLIDTVSMFGENQKIIMKHLTDQIFELEYLDEGYDIVDSFEQELNNSNDLTEEERIQLIEFTSSTRALLDFMSSDGIQAMYAQMAPEFNDSTSAQNGRVMGCDVGWRSVWAGAVVGFTVGAVKGGITGATGGTVVFPGLGTATGAVGGAVFGGALGFIGGATTSVAANLITSCFRPEMAGRHETSCRQQYDYYRNGWINSIPSSCYSVIFGNIKCC
ncbi:hypothetical protein [Marinoscillum furvescens]|nr:hypothetical protein [Marinoscillum furvescens]